MTRSWLILVPVVFGAAPAVAQYTPEQRAAKEAADQYTTIGRTWAIEVEQRSLNDPLRALRCPGDPSATASPCAGAITSGRYGAQSAMQYRAEAPPVRPAVVYGAVGSSATPRDQLHVLGTGAIDLHADRPATLTLASPVGGVKRPLMIRTAVGQADEAPVWSRMHEEIGDPQGRYLVAVPSLSAGRYLLEVEVYDVDHPDAPFSKSVAGLVVH